MTSRIGVSDREIDLRLLTKWGHPLGSFAPAWDGTGSTHMFGGLLVCSACRKVLGKVASPKRDAVDPRIYDDNAGWVLERRRAEGRYILCGYHEACDHCGSTERGCKHITNFEHPLACSDKCEMALLHDGRFERCEPPPGYERGGPHP